MQQHRSNVARVDKEITGFYVACEKTQYGFAGGPCIHPDGTEDKKSWEVRIAGPPNTPYVGVAYKVHVTLPAEFPFEPPGLRFVPPILHCHVDPRTGRVQPEVLLHPWLGSMSVVDYLISLFAMMKVCLNQSVEPLNAEAAECFHRTPIEFEEMVYANVLENHADSDSEH